MKIVFVINSLNGGGAERVASILANAWAARGDEVEMVATYSLPSSPAFHLDAGINVRILAKEVSGASLPVLGQIFRLLRLRSIIKKKAPDAVLAFLTPSNIHALVASFGLSTPVVVSERTYPPNFRPGAAMEWLRTHLYPRASVVVMQTAHGREWLSSCIPAATGVVIPNPAAAPSAGYSRTSSAGRYRILGVGRLDADKQFDKLIEAFSSLAIGHPDWELQIAGEGPESDSLHRLTRRLGLEGRVTLLGKCTDISGLFQTGDLFVSASRLEGFPNALMEAMAHGLPVIAVDCMTGPRDIIRNGIDGLLVPPGQGAAGLARAMDALMSSATMRGEFSRQAVTVCERFSLDKIIEQWDRVLLPTKRKS